MGPPGPILGAPAGPRSVAEGRLQRLITFLLTDVAGSTPLWDADPPGMAAALADHDALVAAVVERHGGTLVKTKGEGDSTFSVFQQATAAAAAALDLHRELAGHAWPPTLVIQVRAGIHLGEVEIRDGEYFGPTVNRAARLRGLAGPGETLVSRATAEVLIDDPAARWNLEDLGLQALRGLSRPEHVYRLVDPTQATIPTADVVAQRAPAAAPDLPLSLAGTGAPFVGRTGEAARLRAAWEATAAGQSTAVLIGGEPGIGKTSLAGDLARLCRSQGATVLYGRCDEQVSVPYQPFVDGVRELVGRSSDEELAADPRALAELARLEPRLADRFADRLAGLPSALGEEPETERHALFEAVAALLARSASTGPILLVLDDLHWATAPTALLVRHLLLHPVPRVAVVGTYRDTEVGPDHPLDGVLREAWRLANVQRMDLVGLSHDAVTDLLELVSGHEMDDRGVLLARRLEEGTGGNPFFVVELLRHLAETGVIYESAGRWTTDVDLTTMSLPASVVDVLQDRLDRLPPDARRVLTCAAVAGTELDPGLLAAATDVAVEQVIDLLDGAVDAGLLAERGDDLVFAHALVRASMLSSVSTLRRRRWHRTIADILAARPPAARPVEALAHHYGEAARQDPELAVTAASYALAATRRAAAALAHEEALGHVDQGLAALQLTAEPDLSIRCDLLLAAAKASFAVVGRTDGCRRPALAAGLDAVALGDPERVAQAAELAMGGLVMTYDTSYELRIVDAALGMPTDPALTARLTAARSLALLGANLVGDQEEAARAVELARASGDDVALIAALHARSATLLRSPDLTERVARADELDRLRGRASGLANRVALSPTDVELYRGAAKLMGRDLEALAQEIDVLEELYDATGDWELRYFAIAHRATLAAVHGDLAALEKWADEMIAHDAIRPPDPELRSFHPITDGSSIGNNSIRLYAAYQFILHRERGLIEGLLPLFEQAIEDDPTIVVFGAALAVALADVGQLDAARARFDQTLASGIEDLPRDQIWPLLIGVLCEGCALVGAREWVPALRREAEPFSGQISAGAIATIVFDLMDRCLGMLDVAEERWDDAIARFDAAAEQAREMDAPVWEARALAWAAHAHLRRAAPGDDAAAGAKHAQAVRLADDLGYHGLQEAVSRRRPGPRRS